MNNTVWMLVAPGRFEKYDFELPDELPSDYVLLHYLYCGICGGDYSSYLGRRNSYPMSLGHEFVARIIKVGRGVKSYKPGDLVVSDFNYRCGFCSYCQVELSHLCESNSKGLFSNRGFARKGIVHQNYLSKVEKPYLLDTYVYCLIEPLSCVLHAYKTSDISPTDHILIIGGGGIGMLFYFMLSECLGHESVSLRESSQKKLNTLKNCFPKISRVHNNSNYTYVIDASNSPEGLSESLEQTRPGGKICVMSHLYGLDTSFVYDAICKKELHAVFPLRNGSQKNMLEAQKLLAAHWRKEYNSLLEIFPDVDSAFASKQESFGSKQIVNLQGIPDEADAETPYKNEQCN